MSWLKRIWSKIWVDPRPENSSRDAEFLDLDVHDTATSIVVETDLYKVWLSAEWSETENIDPEQSCFHNASLNIDLVISHIFANIPEDKLQEAASVLLTSQVENVDRLKSENGVSPSFESQDVIEKNWGYQASVVRRYKDNEVYLFSGFVSPRLVLNVTLEGQDEVMGTFDTASMTVLSGIRFSDEVWGDRDASNGPSIH